MLLQANNNANSNLAAINQQISNLGSINQQLTSLSHQLSGLGGQHTSSNFHNFSQVQHQQQPPQQQQHASPINIATRASLTAGVPQTNNTLTLSPGNANSSLHQSQSLLHLNASPIAAVAKSRLSVSPFPSMTQLQPLAVQHNQQQQQQQLQENISKDLLHINQELLSRLQSLQLGTSAPASLSLAGGGNAQAASPSPRNSIFFVNPMSSCAASATPTPTPGHHYQPNQQQQQQPMTHSYSFLGAPSPNSLSNLTPSPLGTLNRNSYSSSSPITDEMRLSLDKNLNILIDPPIIELNNGGGGGGGSSISNGGHLAMVIAQQHDNVRRSSTINDSNNNSHNTGNNSNASFADNNNGSHNNNNNAECIMNNGTNMQQNKGNHDSNGISNSNNVSYDNTAMEASSPRAAVRNGAQFNTVMLRVTDEAGNVTNQKKLSATPCYITRSTSEKVANRSQMISQVQRTAWARHTTK